MKFLSYVLSSVFAVIFFLTILIFHPLQWLSLNLLGKNSHKKVVEVLNFVIIKLMLIVGTRVILKNKYKIPKECSIIFVSNHQSIFDIPPIVWFFRKHNPKFVAKKELGKGIPSISYNLKHGGSVLIDRENSNQAMDVLVNFSKTINKNNWGVAIFPEGTRSRTGHPKRFATNGLKIITKYNKNGYIVPLTINNSWKVFKYGKFPLGLGNNITITAHEPVKISSLSFEELFKKTESIIKKHVIN